MIAVRQVWKSTLGGHPVVVCAVDDTMVYVKRADFSKRSIEKQIARGTTGAGLVSRSEFADYRLILEDYRHTQEVP